MPVLSVCSKILEKAVHKKLIDHLEINKLLSKMQFGYRKKTGQQNYFCLITFGKLLVRVI